MYLIVSLFELSVGYKCYHTSWWWCYFLWVNDIFNCHPIWNCIPTTLLGHSTVKQHQRDFSLRKFIKNDHLRRRKIDTSKFLAGTVKIITQIWHVDVVHRAPITFPCPCWGFWCCPNTSAFILVWSVLLFGIIRELWGLFQYWLFVRQLPWEV